MKKIYFPIQWVGYKARCTPLFRTPVSKVKSHFKLFTKDPSSLFRSLVPGRPCRPRCGCPSVSRSSPSSTPGVAGLRPEAPGSASSSVPVAWAQQQPITTRRGGRCSPSFLTSVTPQKRPTGKARRRHPPNAVRGENLCGGLLSAPGRCPLAAAGRRAVTSRGATTQHLPDDGLSLG